jgi:hypothetical protein
MFLIKYDDQLKYVYKNVLHDIILEDCAAFLIIGISNLVYDGTKERILRPKKLDEQDNIKKLWRGLYSEGAADELHESRIPKY